MTTSFVLEGYEIFVTPSIGISLYPDHGDNTETLFKYADTAMYQAKDQGKNNYQFYTPEMHNKVLRRMSLEKELRKALENNEFLLHYQPQVNIKSGSQLTN